MNRVYYRLLNPPPPKFKCASRKLLMREPCTHRRRGCGTSWGQHAVGFSERSWAPQSLTPAVKTLTLPGLRRTRTVRPPG